MINARNCPIYANPAQSSKTQTWSCSCFAKSITLSRTEPREGTEEHLKWQDEMTALHAKAEVIVGKQRHGPIGTVKLSFTAELTKFGNLAFDDRYDESPH